MNKKNWQHATIPLIFINKTISFYLQYVFDRIIFILPGQLTGAAVAVEVVDAEALLPGQLTGAAVDVEVVDAEVVVLFSMVCMWTP